MQGLALALAANPWALLLTGVAAVGANIYTEYKDMQVGIHGRKARNMRQERLPGFAGLAASQRVDLPRAAGAASVGKIQWDSVRWNHYGILPIWPPER